jgi:hypothetical protein
MKTTWLPSLFMVMALATIIILITSCNKKFDLPPAFVPGNARSTLSINEFKMKYPPLYTLVEVTDNDTISGIIVGDDKSGNIYKEIFLQDVNGEGGIAIQLDGSSLYGNYPVGRKLFIVCKGLFVGSKNGLIQLGESSTALANTIAGIPPSKFRDYIIKDSLYGRAYVDSNLAQKISYSQMGNAYQSMLIRLDKVEIDKANLSSLYSDISLQKNSFKIRVGPGCGVASSAFLYNSAYADFAGQRVPQGSGTLFSIYVPYNSDTELIIRDPGDVKLYGTRCQGGIASVMSLASLRQLYQGSDVILDSDLVKGIVISDAATANIAKGNIVIQDGTSGIDLFFGSNTSVDGFKMGDSIVVNITGAKLTTYNGLMEVSLLPAALPASAAGTGKTVIPQQLTISQLTSGIIAQECTLVRIVNATITPAGTFSGYKTITDDPASIGLTLYTEAASLFSSATLPTTCQNWVGYATRYASGIQFQIRNQNDLSNGSGCGANQSPTDSGISLTTSPLTLNFNSISKGLPAGVSVYTGGSSGVLGTATAFTSGATKWSITTGGFYNFASTTGLTSSSKDADQTTATNRALGVRQIGTTSSSFTDSDPGAAFVFQINNTTGKSTIKLDFLLQSLDVSSSVTRTTTWTVDYAIGASPVKFLPVTATGSLTTGNTVFSSNAISVNFGSILNNHSEKIWIRIITLTATSGSGSRPSTAIDDVKFSWL